MNVKACKGTCNGNNVIVMRKLKIIDAALKAMRMNHSRSFGNWRIVFLLGVLVVDIDEGKVKSAVDEAGDGEAKVHVEGSEE